MSEELQNQAQRNKRLIFDSESFVYQNVGLVSIARGRADENFSEAMRLYTLASTSNRELIMRLTDDVYRNRMQILDNLQPTTPDQTLYKVSMTNRDRSENLDHRSKVNRQLIEASDKMLEAYRLVKEAAQIFSGINDTMLEHCDDAADRNAQYFDGELLRQMQQADAATNKRRVDENDELVAGIRERAQGNRERLLARFNAAAAESESLTDMGDRLESQRSEIMALREKIDANRNRVADTIFKM
ncbi:MAG: hypothetical protein FJ196_05470 [Gammaproteobacteria bacterium]|nr:hypothetical protein [Gammaproteobacteria bacterium]